MGHDDHGFHDGRRDVHGVHDGDRDVHGVHDVGRVGPEPCSE